MTTFAKRLAALPKYPRTLSDMSDGSFGGLMCRQRDALEARLRLAVELLERSDPFEHCSTGCDWCYACSRNARALVEKVRGELSGA